MQKLICALDSLFAGFDKVGLIFVVYDLNYYINGGAWLQIGAISSNSFYLI